MTKGLDYKRLAKANTPLIAFVFLFILAIVVEGTTFLNMNNLINILLNNAIIGIIALGMMLIIVTAGIDLSVGSMLALTGLVGIWSLNHYGSIVVAILAALAAGAIFGLLTGVFVAKFAVPSFIVTLGTMSIYRSVGEYWFNGGGITANGHSADGFIAIANTTVLGLPIPVWLWLLFSVLIALMAKYTAFGRHIFAVGSNPRATRLAGINTHRVLIGVYLLAGVLVALASILEASRLGSMNSASSGTGYEMDAIAATVIGGTVMTGGRGTVLGTTFGTLTLGIINNLMNLMGMPAFLVGAIKGAIIVLAVLLQRVMDDQE
ncbi:ABC transporter permease [Lacticaseibacillus sp. GG6-2]